MTNFTEGLIKRLNDSGIRVTEKCTYWKPILVGYKFGKPGKETARVHSNEFVRLEHSNIDTFLSGRAVNQYFIQKRIAETTNATLWRCYDVLRHRFCCVKLFHISACRRERSVRFFREDTEVISLLDKAIDEVVYHCSLQEHPGVCGVQELIVDAAGDLLYFVLDHYAFQLMNFDYDTGGYTAPYVGELYARYLYTEKAAKELLRQLVPAIGHCHANGVIHKDIKPDNILLSNVEAEMFERFESPDKVLHNSNSYEQFMDPTPLNEDCEELLEKADVFRTTEVHAFELEPVVRSLPGDIVHMGFPYYYHNHFDFIFSMWDEAKEVVDLNRFAQGQGKFHVGSSALAFARHLHAEAADGSASVGAYFLNGAGALKYSINRKFVRSESGEPESLSDSPINDTLGIGDIIPNIGCGYSEFRGRTGSASRSTATRPQPSKKLKTGSNVQAAISDFGVASMAEVEAGKLVIFDSEGTISFTSPECLRFIDGSIAAAPREVFALGVTLYCMVYGALPYSAKSGIEMLISIIENPLVFHPFRKISSNLRSLLALMLHKEHEQRIRLEELLSHPWFAE